MSWIDWAVLVFTLLLIVLYGVYKSRGATNIETYLLADRQMPWYQVGFSVMATQASAITFLSAPGQAYNDGLRFVQFYFGLPIAMIVLCVAFIPAFRNLNVYTAYEYLEKRFDSKTRSLTAFLFLLQRGLSTGLTIYAPSIILSTLLSVDIRITTWIMGSLVILYTVYGGTKAVSYTQMLQMGIIFAGLFGAGYMVVHLMPQDVGFSEALHIAGKMGKMNVVDTSFDWNNRYNIWSGIIGGFFLQLSYFGTDQSQVGRYLTGKSIAQSRLGLVMNGLIKIPMQFLILLMGVLVFAFYQYHPAPVFFNKVAIQQLQQSEHKGNFDALEKDFNHLQQRKNQLTQSLVKSLHQGDVQAEQLATQSLQKLQHQSDSIRGKVIDLINVHNPRMAEDTNYVFLSFVMEYLPKGLVGLLIAIIFLAAMGSTAGGLNALASTTVVDMYKRFLKPEASERHYLSASRWATIIWGLFCIVVALYAGKLGNLIESVNILGSLFYGTILGVFLVAFWLKGVQGNAVFISAIVTEIVVVIVWKMEWMAFLWLNVLGCLLLMLLALLLQKCLPLRRIPS